MIAEIEDQSLNTNAKESTVVDKAINEKTHSVTAAKQAAKTGDTNNVWLYVVISVFALGIMGANVVVMRRKADRW